MNTYYDPMTDDGDIAVPATGGAGNFTPRDKPLIDPGTYAMEVTEIDTWMGTKYQSDEPQRKVRITATITEGPYKGVALSRIEGVPRSIANENAGLHKVYKGITGVTPVEGGDYRLKRDLLGKRCMGVVVDHKSGEYSIIQSFSPQAPLGVTRRPPPGAATAATAAPRRAAAPPTPDDDDDDLWDA